MGKCYNSAIINGTRDEVWNTIKDFHNLSWGDLVVTKVDAVGGISGYDAGAKRILNDAFHETLISVDSENYSFTYSIDDGPAPLNKDNIAMYVGEVRLLPVTDSGTTFIEWVSTFESNTDKEVADFCNPIYAGLLSSLKSKF